MVTTRSYKNKEQGSFSYLRARRLGNVTLSTRTVLRVSGDAVNNYAGKTAESEISQANRAF